MPTPETQNPVENPGHSDTEKWVWERVLVGEVADLNTRCGVELDPRQGDDARWHDDCRRISAAFIQRVLAEEPWRGALPRRGLRVIGARVEGLLDLSAERVATRVWLDRSRFGDAVSLQDARFESSLSFEGSAFEAGVDANGLQVGGHLFLHGGAAVRGGPLVLVGAKVEGQLAMVGSAFEAGVDANGLQVGRSLFLSKGAVVRGGPLVLVGAKVEGNLVMDGSAFEAGVGANGLQVGRDLYLREGAAVRGRPLVLVGAKVEGQLEINGSAFEAGVDANGLQVGGHLFLHGGTAVRGGPLVLVGAKVEGHLAMDGSAFEAGVDANGLQVGRGLFLREGAAVRGGPLVLVGAKVEGNLAMDGSAFEAGVDADGLQVGGGLFLRGATFAVTPEIVAARIGGDLDLNGAELAGLDLSGTTIGGDLRLSQGRPLRWREGARLVLRNVHAGALQDRLGEDGRDICWPPGPGSLDLQGFTCDRLGGLIGGGQDPMLLCSPNYYTDLLARDPTFARQPYQQLAAVFRAAGYPDKAEAILYAARDRERAEDWRRGRYWSALGLGLLKATIGYGLTSRFPRRVLFWVLALTALGAGILWFRAPEAQARGLPWCLLAGLDHLLPIVELNKGFSEFFDASKGPIKDGLAFYYFAIHPLFGFALGSFVVAALAGLTQGRR